MRDKTKQKAYNRQYYIDNKEKILARHKEHNKQYRQTEKGKEALKQGNKRYYQTERGKEEIRVRNKKIYDENPEFWSRYGYLHKKMRKIVPQIEEGLCTICNEHKDELVLASIEHTYTENVEDWIWLCRECHYLYDKCWKKKNEVIKEK